MDAINYTLKLMPGTRFWEPGLWWHANSRS